MTKLISYNQYGAPEQDNPKWCDLISWCLNKVGNLCYRLNGGVVKWGNNNLRGRLTTWFWYEAYAWGDIQWYSRIKGYKLPERVKK